MTRSWIPARAYPHYTEIPQTYRRLPLYPPLPPPSVQPNDLQEWHGPGVMGEIGVSPLVCSAVSCLEERCTTRNILWKSCYFRTRVS